MQKIKGSHRTGELCRSFLPTVALLYLDLTTESARVGGEERGVENAWRMMMNDDDIFDILSASERYLD